jgi:hypothetical protein
MQSIQFTNKPVYKGHFYRKHCMAKMNIVIDWCLMPTLAVFELLNLLWILYPLMTKKTEVEKLQGH